MLKTHALFIIFTASLLHSCSTRINGLNALILSADTTSSWSLRNGQSSIDLTATPTKNSTVYYAVYDADQGTLTASAVKAASASCAGACKSGGNFSATPSGTTQSINGLAEKKLYHVYAVTENSTTGLSADSAVKHYSGVLPKKQSLMDYSTGLMTKIGVGQTIRYLVTVPETYYDQSTTSFPVVMYIHGGGDRSNNVGNPESDISLLQQTPFSAYAKQGTNFSAIIVQPHCNEALWNCTNVTDSQFLAEAVDQVNATFRTNTKKFSAIGMSYGGSGALHLAYDYPAKISAVVAMAGGLFSTGSRPAAAGDLCPRFATGKVALWAINNVQDPWYSSAGVTGNSGTYPGTVVSTINTNCTGQPDARFTELNDNTTVPLNNWPHEILYLVLGSSYFDYGYCTGGYGWKVWTGATCVADTDPPSYFITKHPQIVSDLQTASTALTGSSTTFTSVVDWAISFTKP